MLHILQVFWRTVPLNVKNFSPLIFLTQALSHTHVNVVNSDEGTKADVSR